MEFIKGIFDESPDTEETTFRLLKLFSKNHLEDMKKDLKENGIDGMSQEAVDTTIQVIEKELLDRELKEYAYKILYGNKYIGKYGLTEQEYAGLEEQFKEGHKISIIEELILHLSDEVLLTKIKNIDSRESEYKNLSDGAIKIFRFIMEEEIKRRKLD